MVLVELPLRESNRSYKFGRACTKAHVCMSKATTSVFVIVALLLHCVPLLQRAGPWSFSHVGFVMPVAKTPATTIPVHHEELINPDSSVRFSHVASICELANGRLAAVWYAGSREGARDVAIYLAIRDPESSSWSKPRPVVTRESAERDLQRRIKKVGNSVVFSDKAGRLWLVYVTVSMGGWSGSSLNVTRSSDEGVTWSCS